MIEPEPTSRTRPLIFGISGAAANRYSPLTIPSPAPVGHRGLRVVLVVHGDVVEDVLAVDVHPPDAVPDDRGQLEGEGRVVGADHGHGRGEHVGVAVVVLQALARQRGPARGGRRS